MAASQPGLGFMSSPTGGSVNSSPSTDDKTGPPSRWNQFVEKRLKAWQPVLAPKRIIAVYIICGLVFTGVGIMLLLVSQGVVEVEYDYTDNDVASGVGYFDMEITRDMEPPIWLHYQLEGFHQNHRRYIRSIAETQMKVTTPETDASQLDSCKPWVVTDGRVNYPCGLVARSVFNDSYVLTMLGPEDDKWNRVEVDSRAKTIAWASDTEGKFTNMDPEAKVVDGVENQKHLNMWINQRFPPVECVQKEVSAEKPYRPVYVAMREEEVPLPSNGSAVATSARSAQIVDCTGYFPPARESGVSHPRCKFVREGENFQCTGNYEERQVEDWGIQSGHFIVWMRIAGLPTFRKLWGMIDEPLKAGSTLRVHYSDNFPVKEFHGRKSFVVTTTSVLGGRNDFLGYGYIVVGCCCLIFGATFLWQNIVKPRPLGDISLLADI
eukprot:TRINITY_DN74885_c0_g1_i1.p1 TRINITY_DN74885_c0_g1~~TRINITY_DN74885_c0_g1_i1.p1  ORF type:complete len:436 (+),score=53.75 TRINITY_DN74885_c0_g1_i1:123-1430(+)